MNFDKEGSKFDEKFVCVCGGGAKCTDTKTVCKNVSFFVCFLYINIFSYFIFFLIFFFIFLIFFCLFFFNIFSFFSLFVFIYFFILFNTFF